MDAARMSLDAHLVEVIPREAHSYPPGPGIKGLRSRRLRRASTQLKVLGLTFFFGPGMVAALTGLGSGSFGNFGPVNSSLIATYATCAIVGFFSGPIVSRIGFRVSLLAGSLAYAFYAACLYIYKVYEIEWLLLLSGTLVGVLSSLSWTAQGGMLLCYPTAETKGRYMAFAWAWFNSGAIFGSIIVIAANFKALSHNDTRINDPTFYAFIALMSLAVPISLAVLSNGVTRSDDSTIVRAAPMHWRTASMTFCKRLWTDTYIVAMFPMLFASNWYLPYLFNDINMNIFTVHTRAVNVILFYSAGIIGSFTCGKLLDLKTVGMRRTNQCAIAALVGMFMLIWGCTFAWQRNYTRDQTLSPTFVPIDCSSTRYAIPALLFFAFGFVHFVFQACIYWFLNALADNSRTADRLDFSGFFKNFQATGSACALRISNKELPFIVDLALGWGLVVGSLIVAAPVLLSRIQDIKESVIIDAEVNGEEGKSSQDS